MCQMTCLTVLYQAIECCALFCVIVSFWCPVLLDSQLHLPQSQLFQNVMYRELSCETSGAMPLSQGQQFGQAKTCLDVEAVWGRF